MYSFSIEHTGDTEVALEDDSINNALIAPILAELVGANNDAVCVVFLDEVCQTLLSCTHFILRHEARAVEVLR